MAGRGVGAVAAMGGGRVMAKAEQHLPRGVRDLGNGSFQARYMGPDGKRYGRVFRKARDAGNWYLLERAAMETGRWMPPKEQAELVHGDASAVAVAVERYISDKEHRGNIKRSTADNYRKLLRLTIEGTALGAMPLSKVKKSDVEHWRYHVLPRNSRTQNGAAYNLLHAVFEVAVEDQVVQKTLARFAVPANHGLPVNRRY